MKKIGIFLSLVLICVHIQASAPTKDIQNLVHQALASQGRQYTSKLEINPLLATFLIINPAYQKLMTFICSKSIQHAQTIFTQDELKHILSTAQNCIHQQSLADVAVSNHPQKQLGYGVFARRIIAKGEVIGEYTGVLQPVLNDNSKYAWETYLPRPSQTGDKEKGRQFELKVGFTENHKSPTLFIDAALKGNELSYANHNGNISNCYALWVNYCHTRPDEMPGRTQRVVIVAQKSIAQGEELTIDYGPYYRLEDGSNPVSIGTYNLLEENDRAK